MCGRNPKGVHNQLRLMKDDGWEEGGRRRGVSYRRKAHNEKVLYSPAIPDTAFTGCFAAAALSWWPYDGREEEEGRRRDVSLIDEKNTIKRTSPSNATPVLIMADCCAAADG